MNPTEFIWKNGKMIPWNDANVHILTHGLHYGSAVFEGIRCYQTDQGPAIFKLKEHVERFFYSAHHLGMQLAYTVDELQSAIVETVRQNKQEECYIRPLAYYGYGSMKVVPPEDLAVDVMIACWPWGDYFDAKAVDIAISPFIRIHPKSTVADAKISGHYVNSILSGLSIRNTPYHEALLLDVEGYVAEAGAANIFIVKNNKITTTPSGTILMGITRDVIISIARELGYEIEERRFKPEEIYDADEAFFSGTAVEVMAIRSIDDRVIGKGEAGPVTLNLKDQFNKVTRGVATKYNSALTWVNQH